MRWIVLYGLTGICFFGCNKNNDEHTDLPWDSEPFCGDGILDDGEVCDDGDLNSDQVKDVCRTNCTWFRCGDAVLDTDESCDDGGLLGGDGCSGFCIVETGTAEVEPNDHPQSGQDVVDRETIHGSLTDFDVDCFRFDIPEYGWIGGEVLPDLGEDCHSDHVLTVRNANNSVLATSFADPSTGACAFIEPLNDSDLQYMPEGSYALCIEGMLGSKVNSYSLVASVGDDSCDQEFPIPDGVDQDGDGIPDGCEDDDDNDGFLDSIDNCPNIPNSSTMAVWMTPEKGHFNRWLISGPYNGTDSPGDECEPALQAVTYFSDGEVTPAISDEVPGVPWRVAYEPDDRISFLDYYGGTTPREAYAVSWFFMPEEREGVLSMGADDGFRVWLDGEQIDSIPTCQGVSPDQYQWPVTLTTGWHRLTARVRDHGGSWGLMARILHEDGSTPMNDLELSIHPYGRWIDNQNDTDNDNIGDVCDPKPNDPDE